MFCFRLECLISGHPIGSCLMLREKRPPAHLEDVESQLYLWPAKVITISCSYLPLLCHLLIFLLLLILHLILLVHNMSCSSCGFSVIPVFRIVPSFQPTYHISPYFALNISAPYAAKLMECNGIVSYSFIPVFNTTSHFLLSPAIYLFF